MEARICPGLGQTCCPRYRPQPDDEAELGEAMQAATQLELLSPEASEAFIQWMEGTGDEAWRVELE